MFGTPEIEIDGIKHYLKNKEGRYFRLFYEDKSMAEAVQSLFSTGIGSREAYDSNFVDSKAEVVQDEDELIYTQHERN